MAITTVPVVYTLWPSLPNSPKQEEGSGGRHEKGLPPSCLPSPLYIL